MGRYYSGDIEGKFWFGIQSSDAADRFGVFGQEPNYLYYYFDRDDLPAIEEELAKIEGILGEYLEKLNKFFDEHNGYNDAMVEDYLQIDEVRRELYLKQYADYLLGIQIRDAVIENDSCEFQAEL